MSKQEWPIDFDSLEIGSIIEQSAIERAYAVKYKSDPQAYQYKLMELAEEIRKRRPELSGNIREDKQAIRVMTNTEADDWQNKRYFESVRAISRIGKRRGAINRSDFDANRIARAESLDVGLAATLITAKQEMRKHRRLLAMQQEKQLPPGEPK